MLWDCARLLWDSLIIICFTDFPLRRWRFSQNSVGVWSFSQSDFSLLPHRYWLTCALAWALSQQVLIFTPLSFTGTSPHKSITNLLLSILTHVQKVQWFKCPTALLGCLIDPALCCCHFSFTVLDRRDFRRQARGNKCCLFWKSSKFLFLRVLGAESWTWSASFHFYSSAHALVGQLCCLELSIAPFFHILFFMSKSLFLL